MGRKRIKNETMKKILLKCRRRCCICYGLHRDTSIKQGQIAHIDHNSSNSSINNLAFLCLNHHDQYDSSTSQSKKLTINEIKEFKKELEDHISKEWKEASFSKHFDDELSGHYIRINNNDSSAEIDIRDLGNGKIYVNGFALWGLDSKYGPNIGELDFSAPYNNSKAFYSDGDYKVELNFVDKNIIINEKNSFGHFGMNVQFEGIYKKIEN